MAACGSAAQRGLWPPVALQPSAGYGRLWLCSPARAMASLFTRFRDHTQRRATVSRTPLDEWSASSQRPLPDNTQQTQPTNIHAPDWDSNPWSQQASVRRPLVNNKIGERFSQSQQYIIQLYNCRRMLVILRHVSTHFSSHSQTLLKLRLFTVKYMIARLRSDLLYNNWNTFYQFY
jgi:hypothetical protein